MADVYSFVTLVERLKDNENLQDTVEEILKQTIECGFFIQEYARRSFGGKQQACLHLSRTKPNPSSTRYQATGLGRR